MIPDAGPLIKTTKTGSINTRFLCHLDRYKICRKKTEEIQTRYEI